MASEIRFSLPQTSRPAVGPSQPPIQWVLGVLSPNLNNESWSYASPPIYTFLSWTGTTLPIAFRGQVV